MTFRTHLHGRRETLTRDLPSGVRTSGYSSPLQFIWDISSNSKLHFTGFHRPGVAEAPCSAACVLWKRNVPAPCEQEAATTLDSRKTMILHSPPTCTQRSDDGNRWVVWLVLMGPHSLVPPGGLRPQSAWSPQSAGTLHVLLTCEPEGVLTCLPQGPKSLSQG